MAQLAKVKELVKRPDDEWVVEPADDEWVVEAVNADPHPQNPPQSILAQQAAKYPTSAEQGGKPGKAVVSLLNTIIDTEPGTETGLGPEAALLAGASPSNVFAKGAGGLEMFRVPGSKMASLTEQVADSPIGQIGTGLLNRVKAYRSGAAIRQMETKMAPSGVEAKLGTERIAPELTQNPALAKVRAIRFNQKLHEQYKIAGANVHAAEQSVPRGTTIAQAQITDALEPIIEKYREMGATDAASAVAREWEKWASKEANIPWDDFLATKRRLGTQMETMGQFRESGTAAEKATGAAMKEAYRVVAQAGNVSPELTAANHQYWLMNSAMEDAGLSFASGRKISEIGKPPAPGIVRRAVKTGGKVLGRGALTIGGYEAARSILGSK